GCRGGGLGDFVVGDRHVRAVFAQEDERKRVLVLDAQHDGAREARGIDADVADLATLRGTRIDREARESVVTDARNEPGREAKASTPERGVGRRAAKVLGKA